MEDDRGRRGREHPVQRADRVVLLAVLLDAQRVDDAGHLAADLAHRAARRIDGLQAGGGLGADGVLRLQDAVEMAGEFGDGGRLALRSGQPLQALGVNYYHGEFVGAAPDPHPPVPGDAPTDRATGSPWPAGVDIHWHERGLPRTNMGWEVQPEGLTRLLQRVWTDYAQPAGTVLYVTENGAAYDDELVVEDGVRRVHDTERVAFLRGHLGAIADAAESGVDVRGYFYWSLLDNFEWAWGYAKRFGIVRVDYDTQERTPKDSALEYRRVIAARAIDVPSALLAPR